MEMEILRVSWIDVVGRRDFRTLDCDHDVLTNLLSLAQWSSSFPPQSCNVREVRSKINASTLNPPAPSQSQSARQ